MSPQDSLAIRLSDVFSLHQCKDSSFGMVFTTKLVPYHRYKEEQTYGDKDDSTKKGKSSSFPLYIYALLCHTRASTTLSIRAAHLQS